MNYLQTIIMGIVEGFTEFLPISSTAHMILTADLLGVAQSDFVKTFEIVIQAGAILAVVALYGKRLLLDWETMKRLVVAFVPTGIIGLLLYKVFIHTLLGNTMVVIWSLLIGGIALIAFEHWHKEKASAHEDIRTIPYLKCFWIGVCQSLAIIPGVSRSAATIVAGLALGLKRKTIVEFSFLLAVPTMVAASGYDLLKSGVSFSRDETGILFLGFVVAFVVAIVSIKFLLDYIRKHNFTAFGVYRIVAGIVFFLSGIR